VSKAPAVKGKGKSGGVPQGPAQALLKIIDRHPDLAKEILST
jgi:hypothetical protein